MSYHFDPELQPFAELFPEVNLKDPVAARASMDQIVAQAQVEINASGLDISDRNIAGPAGEPDLTVRIYSPSGNGAQRPGLLYIHGGGFVVGNLDSEHPTAVMLARQLGIVVISVGYRLAPEHPWPAGLEDCYAALCWVHEQSGVLGVDRERIGVSGAARLPRNIPRFIDGPRSSGKPAPAGRNARCAATRPQGTRTPLERHGNLRELSAPPAALAGWCISCGPEGCWQRIPVKASAAKNCTDSIDSGMGHGIQKQSKKGRRGTAQE